MRKLICEIKIKNKLDSKVREGKQKNEEKIIVRHQRGKPLSFLRTLFFQKGFSLYPNSIFLLEQL